MGRTRCGPSSQNAPAMVVSPSIHAERSPAATTEWQAARRMAVAPPNGAHTDSRARGSPPLGSTLSSALIPVATCSVVCAPPRERGRVGESLLDQGP